jgi:hypothetical protein
VCLVCLTGTSFIPSVVMAGLALIALILCCYRRSRRYEDEPPTPDHDLYSSQRPVIPPSPRKRYRSDGPNATFDAIYRPDNTPAPTAEAAIPYRSSRSPALSNPYSVIAALRPGRAATPSEAPTSRTVRRVRRG